MYQTSAGPVVDALRQRGVSEAAIEYALAMASESGRPLRDVLVDEQIVTEIELAEALAEAYGIKSVDIISYPVDLAAAAKIPVALSRRHRVLGIAIDDEEIVVAVGDPGDVIAIDDVRAATGLVVRPVVAARDELNKAIDRFQRSESDLDDVAASLADTDLPTSNTLDSMNEDAPIVRYANSLIEQAIENRASDLHLEPTESDMRVRYRIDGVLHEIDTVPRGGAVGLGEPSQDHGERRHHRTPGAAERSHHRGAGRPRSRPAGGHAAHRVGREDRAAGARHRQRRSRPQAARASPRRTTSATQPRSKAARHAAGDRPDRLGQVHDAVRHPHRDQQARS